MHNIFEQFREKSSAQDLAAFLSSVCVLLGAMGPETLTTSFAHMAKMFISAKEEDTKNGRQTTGIGNLLVQNGGEGFGVFLFGQEPTIAGVDSVEELLAALRRIADGAKAAGAVPHVNVTEVNKPPAHDMN